MDDDFVHDRLHVKPVVQCARKATRVDVSIVRPSDAILVDNLGDVQGVQFREFVDRGSNPLEEVLRPLRSDASMRRHDFQDDGESAHSIREGSGKGRPRRTFRGRILREARGPVAGHEAITFKR